MILGNGIEVLGIAVGVYLLVAASNINAVPLRFLVYLISWVCLVFFPHCLAHFVVGRLAGIRFTHYALGKSSITKLRLPVISAVSSMIPLLTLKIDRGSLSVGKSRCAGGYVRVGRGCFHDSAVPCCCGLNRTFACDLERWSVSYLSRKRLLRSVL